VSEIEAVEKKRGGNPNWFKGMAPVNPSGRPKSKLISEAYRARLDADGAERYADIVFEIIENPRAKASDRLAALQEITDRIEGKAVQAHKVEAGLDANTARALLELAEKMRPQIAIIMPETRMNTGDLHVNNTLPEFAPVTLGKSAAE
jgi:hypothetical protein